MFLCDAYFFIFGSILVMGFIRSSGLTTTTRSLNRPPNILLIITDDQDVELGGLDFMPQLKTQLTEQGTTFSNAFVHTPVCCPSRTSILTGRYIHNGGAINNSISGNCGGTEWKQQTEKEHTFAVHLSNAGYKTAYIGKYLNSYGFLPDNQYIPPGWDRWIANKGNSFYYNYSLVQSFYQNLTFTVNHGDDYATDYLPNVIANQTRDWIMEFATHEQPFLIVASYPSPHTPLLSAPQYKGMFDGYQAPRTPNWNSSSNSNKHWIMRQFGAIDSSRGDWIDGVYRKRLSMLLSVDDHVSLFVETLMKSGQLDNTYIIYTSDNGYQLGQHRIVSDKRYPYEHNIKVPFIVRGPGVPKNVSSDSPVLNIDIAPTLVELATGQPEPVETMDGVSFLPLFQEPKPQWRKDFLVSYHGEGDPSCGCTTCPLPPKEQFHVGDCFNNTYHCLRILNTASEVENLMYCRFMDDENFVEFYNLTNDPWQLDNMASQLSEKDKEYLDSRLSEYKICFGTSCRHLSSTAAPLQQNKGPAPNAPVQSDNRTKQPRSASGSFFYGFTSTTSFVVFTAVAEVIFGIHMFHCLALLSRVAR